MNKNNQKGNIIIVAIIIFGIFSLIVGATFLVNNLFIRPKVEDSIKSLRQDKDQFKTNTSFANFNQKIQDSRSAYANGDYENTRIKASESLEFASSDEEKAVSHYWIGLAYYNLKDYEKSEDELNNSIILKSNYSDPHVTLSAIYGLKGDFSKAFEYALKSKELNPKNPWAWNSLGVSYMNLGNFSEGIKSFEKAVELAPDRYVFQDNLKRAKEAR